MFSCLTCLRCTNRANTLIMVVPDVSENGGMNMFLNSQHLPTACSRPALHLAGIGFPRARHAESLGKLG